MKMFSRFYTAASLHQTAENTTDTDHPMTVLGIARLFQVILLFQVRSLISDPQAYICTPRNMHGITDGLTKLVTTSNFKIIHCINFMTGTVAVNIPMNHISMFKKNVAS